MIRPQCQSQNLSNGMVLVSLTTFHTATIDGIRVWQEYNIGEARFIKRSEFNLPKEIPTPQIKVIEVATSPKATFREVKARKRPAAEHLSSASQAEKPDSSSSDDEETAQETKMFQCPDDGCVSSFQRFSSLQRHLDVGKHKYVLERETLLDKAMLSYARPPNLSKAM